MIVMTWMTFGLQSRSVRRTIAFLVNVEQNVRVFTAGRPEVALLRDLLIVEVIPFAVVATVRRVVSRSTGAAVMTDHAIQLELTTGNGESLVRGDARIAQFVAFVREAL
jgi:hypothetical protein